MPLPSKSEILKACYSKIEVQIAELNAAIAKVKESIAGEEKSSAGDKFETARAMAQKELEQLSVQLYNAVNQVGALEHIVAKHHEGSIHLGSAVITKTKNLFIATALGKIEVQNITFVVISPASPIARVLLGKSKGNTYELVGKTEEILDVF